MSDSDSTTITNLVSPYFEVFSSDIMDLSTVEYEYVNYKENNVSNISGLQRYDIETRDNDSYILPCDGYLDVEYRLMQSDGATNILAKDKIALQNNALSLFKDAEYMIEKN